MAEVRFEHVEKRFGTGAPVIRDLNLRIGDQEFLVLVGPSGCGKSTALRMIAGLEKPTAGEIYLDGARITNVPSERRDVAMVFQGYALFPHMSVYENLAFSLTVRHQSRRQIEEEVRRVAEMLGLTPYLERRPRELSGGQRQRVALGRALVRAPRVFLMDEPLSHLDAKLRVQTRADIIRLHQRVRVTTLYVTHDQVEAMTMGDRIAVMNAGNIEQLGSPRELYDAPATLFVAGFIGSPSMDFFAARLRRTETGAEIVIGEGAEARALPLAGGDAARFVDLATAEGRAVVAGIRPEDLRLASEGEPGTLLAVVDVVEHLGSEQLAYLRVPGALTSESAETKGVTARVAPSVVPRPGERVALEVDTTRLHLFDAESTRRLGRVAEPVG